MPVRMGVLKGQKLIGENVVYDIDAKFSGEVQTQLEVTPITKYELDPNLVIGRQIAVNKCYICVGLNSGTIRVLNINTALRSLLEGLAKSVTDMTFFAENVHLLASASMDGRVYVWKIAEGPDQEYKAQITGKIVIAVQIVGKEEPVRPRVCWHCLEQEVLVVGIGKHVLRINTTKVGRGKIYSAEEPLICSVDKLIDGIQFVGKHDGEVTDLSMCQWMTTRLASASVDGTIKIWEDRKSSPIAVLRPHDGLPVNSVTFLTAPYRPNHTILITGGPLNREVKIWASESKEGWFLPSDADSWHCTQTLVLKSSTEPATEDALFNQVVALSHSGLLLLANTKKKAIYAIHLDYRLNPKMSCMDYIAELTVTYPILSFTGTSDLLPNGEHIVQVYCVQTQAIQQYALELSRCLPPSIYDVYEKLVSTVSRNAMSIEGFAGLEPASGKLEPASPDGALVSSQPLSSPLTEAETKSISPPVANGTDISCVVSPTVPLSPKLSRSISDLLSPLGGFKPRLQLIGYADQKMDYPVDRQLETAHSNLSNVSLLDDDENRVTIERFKHPIHLVTPAEFMATSSAEVNDVPVKSDTRSAEVETKVVGETGISQNADTLLQVELNGSDYEEKGKSKCFSSQASGLGLDMARDMVNESKELDGIVESKVPDQTTVARNEVDDVATDPSGHVETAVGGIFQSVGSSFREKKKKKNVQISAPSFLSDLESADSSAESGVSSSVSSAEAILLQIQSLQETIAQVLINQKEIQKQIQDQFQTSGKQALQEALRSIMETYVVPALQMFCKTMFDQVDATSQKRIAALVPDVVSAVTPFIEMTVSTAVSETFKTGIGDKAVNQLEKAVNSKVEATVSRQTQVQFQTSGKQALQIEAPADLTEDVSKLLDDYKYVEAFTAALQKRDVRVVSWLCSQVDLQQIVMRFPLSQGVLLSLLQQLACDIMNNTSRKLGWMMDVVVAIKPSDEVIADYVRPIFDQVCSLLNHQASLPTTSDAELSNIQTLMGFINSMPKSS